MKKILIIEDDILAAELERDYLEASGFEAEICGNGSEGLKKARDGAYDLLILDVMLPGTNGFEICRQIRQTQNLPVIMVTARQEDVDKIRGLGLGADDYVIKPFNPGELVARVRAHISIHERLLGEGSLAKEQKDVIEAGDLQIQVPYHQVTVGGRVIDLTNKEFGVLLFLINNSGRAVSREMIIENVWGYDYDGDQRTVDSLMKRLKKKLSNSGVTLNIKSIYGVGFRLDKTDEKK